MKRWRKEERARGLPQCLLHAWLALQLFPGILPYRLGKMEYSLSLSGIPRWHSYDVKSSAGQVMSG